MGGVERGGGGGGGDEERRKGIGGAVRTLSKSRRGIGEFGGKIWTIQLDEGRALTLYY